MRVSLSATVAANAILGPGRLSPFGAPERTTSMASDGRHQTQSPRKIYDCLSFLR